MHFVFVVISECQIDYVDPSEYLPSITETNGNENGVKEAVIDPYDQLVKGHLAAEEKKKVSDDLCRVTVSSLTISQEEKRQQAVELERQMVETQDREQELNRQNTKQKKKLLDNLAEEENKMEVEMIKFQKVRDEERKMLNEKMNKTEQQSDFLIKELMDSNMRYSDPAKVMEALEADKKQMEDQFKIANGDIEKLKEKEVLRKFSLSLCSGKHVLSFGNNWITLHFYSHKLF